MGVQKRQQDSKTISLRYFVGSKHKKAQRRTAAL